MVARCFELEGITTEACYVTVKYEANWLKQTDLLWFVAHLLKTFLMVYRKGI